MLAESESYVVRVYRRCRGDPAELVGVVEQVRTGRKIAFHNIAELWDTLVCRGPRAARVASKRGLGPPNVE
jgi:hypothetical protein